LADDTRQVNGQSLQLHSTLLQLGHVENQPIHQPHRNHNSVNHTLKSLEAGKTKVFQQHGEGFLYNLPGFGKVSSSLLSSAIEAVSSDPGCIARSAVCVCITISVPTPSQQQRHTPGLLEHQVLGIGHAQLLIDQHLLAAASSPHTAASQPAHQIVVLRLDLQHRPWVVGCSRTTITIATTTITSARLARTNVAVEFLPVS
jgi:hypothetical protein